MIASFAFGGVVGSILGFGIVGGVVCGVAVILMSGLIVAANGDNLRYFLIGFWLGLSSFIGRIGGEFVHGGLLAFGVGIAVSGVGTFAYFAISRFRQKPNP